MFWDLFTQVLWQKSENNLFPKNVLNDSRPTALLPPRSNGKTRGCYCSCWATDDGREDARNMLCCT